MPLLNLYLNKNDETVSTKVLSELSQLVAQSLGKPQNYMMVSLSESKINMSGSQDAAAFVDLRSIGGINAATSKMLSQKICDSLHKELAIDKARIYCNFSDISASNWGWNGTTRLKKVAPFLPKWSTFFHSTSNVN